MSGRWGKGWRASLLSACCLLGGAAHAQSGQTVRIAFIDPLSGPMADIGRNSLRSWQFVAERHSGARNPAGVRFVVAPFDNKGSPHESLNALKAAIDQGFRYVVQGNGSGVTHVLADAIARHNARRPEAPVLLLNYAATDPALTGERCTYWHFRIEADTTMKVAALVDFLSARPELHKVYLLNQDYAHGQQIARYFKEAVAERLPNLQIVGDELHPAFQLGDFSPYARRVAASGAQALITGNWGEDFVNLVQALQAERVRVPLFTYYAALPGGPKALAQSGPTMPVYQVAMHVSNPPGELGELAADFRRRHKQDYVVFSTHTGIQMLGAAMARARSTDTRRVADVLRGMAFPLPGGTATLRSDDHQLQLGQYITRWQPVDDRHPVDAEGTGYTFAPLQYIGAPVLSQPVRCNLPRP
jgi:branched-chain amino acid transport system substrate-binding protein